MLFNVLGKRHGGMLCTNKPQLTCVDDWCVCVCGARGSRRNKSKGRGVCVSVGFFLSNIVRVSYGPGIDHKTTLWLSVKTRLQQL